MKITRLMLERYGHLGDVTLDFPPDIGLHVVHGANEAGKSTALTAISDFLFGIPGQTPLGFLYGYDRLRIGAELLADDGTRRTLFRLKRRGASLRDEGDTPFDDGVLAPFLHGATRERFERMFGLSAQRLREGGEAIVSGGGEVGSALFQAASGLTGVAALLDVLRDDADKTYKPSPRARTEFSQARQRHADATSAMRAASVEPAAYARLVAEKDALETESATRKKQLDALRDERRRIERIGRTLPHLTALKEATGALALLTDAPELPPDFAARWAAAVTTREVARAKLAGLREQAKQVAWSDATAAPDAADSHLLDEATLIELLANDSAVIAQCARDLPEQIRRQSDAAAEIQMTARDLGLTVTPEAAIDRLPRAIDRTAIARQISASAALAAARDAAREERDRAARAVATARTDLAAATEARRPPIPGLDAAIAAVQADQRLDAECERLQSLVDRETTARDTALVALPLWPPGADIEALKSAKVPVPPTIKAAGDAYVAASLALRDRTREVEAAAAALEQAERAYEARDAADASLIASVATVRRARDTAWSAIRADYLAGRAPPDAGTADEFAGLVAQADQLADRCIDGAAAAGAARQALETVERLRAERDRANANVTAATAARDAAEAAWHAIWAPAGFTPDAPDAMHAWLVARDAVLSKHAAADAAAHELGEAQRRRQEAMTRLHAFSTGDNDRLRDRLDRAVAAQTAITDSARQHADAATKLREAEAALAEAEALLARRDEALSSWRDGWSRLMPAIGLGPDATPDVAQDALGHWTAIAETAVTWREATARAEAMRARIHDFGLETDALAARLGLPRPTETSPADFARDLGRRLAEARKRRDAAAQAAEAASSLAKQTTAAEGHVRLAQAEVDALLALAGVNDVAALPDAMAKARERDKWRKEQDRAEQDLGNPIIGDGYRLDELDDMARGWEPDTARARLDAIDIEINALNEAATDAAGRLATIVAELDAASRGASAASAAQARRQAEAEMAEAAERWTQLHIMETVLRAAMERFRRDQQDPLLRLAAAHFRTLTGGRYDRLTAEAEDKGAKVLYAHLPADGGRCASADLSEGTRDQLYLALRVAALEQQAKAGQALPFIADDLLASFDDRRAAAALKVLATLGQSTQVILFTHHSHVAELATHCAGANVIAMGAR